MSNIGTTTLTSASATISSSAGIFVIAMKLVSGTVTYKGPMNFAGLTPSAITLVASDPVTIGGNIAIDGLVIDATAGSVQLIARSGQ